MSKPKQNYRADTGSSGTGEGDNPSATTPDTVGANRTDERPIATSQEQPHLHPKNTPQPSPNGECSGKPQGRAIFALLLTTIRRAFADGAAEVAIFNGPGTLLISTGRRAKTRELPEGTYLVVRWPYIKSDLPKGSTMTLYEKESEYEQ
ncbi:MAG: hypothetical protein ACOYYS_19375 [Chloroflexota bacterium]